MTPSNKTKTLQTSSASETTGVTVQTETNQRKTNRLGFLKDIFKSMGVTQVRVQEKTGIKQQLISYWYSMDDCKLSDIDKVGDGLGITVTCSFEPTETATVVARKEEYTLELGELPVDEDAGRREISTSILDQSIKKGGRLAFLAETIKSLSPNLPAFCDANEIKYWTAYKWFTSDDIKLSKLYDIAEKNGYMLKWRAEKKK